MFSCVTDNAQRKEWRNVFCFWSRHKLWCLTATDQCSLVQTLFSSERRQNRSMDSAAHLEQQEPGKRSHVRADIPIPKTKQNIAFLVYSWTKRQLTAQNTLCFPKFAKHSAAGTQHFFLCFVFLQKLLANSRGECFLCARHHCIIFNELHLRGTSRSVQQVSFGHLDKTVSSWVGVQMRTQWLSHWKKQIRFRRTSEDQILSTLSKAISRFSTLTSRKMRLKISFLQNSRLRLETH